MMDYLKKPLVLTTLAVVIILILGGVSFYYLKITPSQAVNTGSEAQKAAQEEIKKLVSEVGKLIALPTDEDPTVATVTDVTKLQDQPFFQKAKNGDKVLIYTNARKAILYDPNARKVIDVAPINIGSQSAQVSQPKVALRNGTSTVGLTSKVEGDLKKSIPNLNVAEKENAGRNDYEKTTVIVLNDSAKDYALNLAKLLQAEAGSLPEGETRPKDVDILVILGKNSI